MFFQPLYLEAWIVLVLFSLSIPFLIAMITLFRKSKVFSWENVQFYLEIDSFLSLNRNNDLTFTEKHQQNKHWTLMECFALTFRSLIMLGTQKNLDSDRKRILAVSVMLGGMVLYWFWESTLISYMVIPTKEFPFHSLEEFYEKTNTKVNHC